jgi:hypothetical protein
MAFSLCFNGDFFEDLHEAIEVLAQDKDEWAKVASWFDIENPEHLAVSTVFDKARELDTCDDLVSPISVWLCEGGWYTVDVPDKSWVQEMVDDDNE